MKASMFIHDLQELIETYGDLEVVDAENESVMVSYSQGEEQDEDSEDYDEDAAEDKFVVE